jgi:predicted  nucleic acid-binding Zn-ribbon protein
MSRPFKLYRLQQIDSQLDRNRNRLREIEAALQDHTSLQLVTAQNEAAAFQAKERARALHRAEEEVTQLRIKIEQTEAALYGGKVRNPKELQDLQNEAISLKKYLAVLEDRQIEAMLAQEEAEELLSATATQLQDVRRKVAEVHASLATEQTLLSKDVLRQESERQAAITGLPPEDLRLYEQLRQNRNGIAVAKVTDQACAACGSTLSAALLSAARSPNLITRCATCGRILYAL